MSLMKETAKFIVELNKFIRSANAQDERTARRIQSIRRRIESIIEKTSLSEGCAVALLAKLISSEQPESDVLYVRKDGGLRAAVSLKVMKPSIVQLEPITNSCNCPPFEFQHFSSQNACIYIETEEILFEVDRCLDKVCIEVLDHTYRSYKGFACFIAVYTQSGTVYIIDAIKFRETIPKLRLLHCGVQKLIHCAECIQRLHADFGNIGCYRNFSIYPRTVYVDWRIRPLNSILLGTILEDLREMVEKVNTGLITEKHDFIQRVEISDFIEKFSLPPDCPMLPEILKLRQYLGRKYDEGIQYVLPDSQLLMLLEATPTTVESFDQLFPRMSSVVRLHAGDFILILRRRAHIFSLERLKEKKNCAGQDQVEKAVLFQLSSGKYRRFDKNKSQDENSGEFCISSCEQ